MTLEQYAALATLISEYTHPVGVSKLILDQLWQIRCEAAAREKEPVTS